MGIKKFDKKDKIIVTLLLIIMLVLVLTLTYSDAASPCVQCKFDVDKFDLVGVNCREFATYILEECNCFCDQDLLNQINQQNGNGLVAMP